MPEINTGESQTIPDASISMRQILDRFQRGILLQGHLEPLNIMRILIILIIWNLMIFILLNWNNLKKLKIKY